MRKIDPEVDNARGREVVLLHEVPQHQGLVQANRMLLILVLALMAFVFILGLVLLPSDDLLDRVKNRQQQTVAYQALQNPVLSAEINTLKSQLVGLVSGSIESKLRTLEESIRLGSISSSLGTIEDLKNDVKVLRSYSEPPQRNNNDSQINEVLLQELSRLKNLIYLTFASCGLMVAAIAAFLLRNRFRISYQGQRNFLGLKK